MKKILLVLIAIGAMACKNNKPETANELIRTPNGLANAAKAPVQMASQSTAQSAGLNPAHGQPGHRCDIAVGAPLSTPMAPSATAQPQIATQTSTPVQASAATTTVSTPVQAPQVNAKGQKLNPPHGQPNHRCDIKVGDPLDSKPITANVSTPAATPATATTTPILNEKGQMLNPAHGQPNHRCDIAVGAPIT